MLFFSQLLFAAAASLVGRSLALPLIVHPGTAQDIVITANNTVNATEKVATAPAAATGQLNLALVNNLANSEVNAYITGLDSNNDLVMLQPDGSWFYPTTSSLATPQAVVASVAIACGGYGSTTYITLPSQISAGRVWFAAGELQFFTVNGETGPSLVEPSAVNPSDPSADVSWGFVELTNSVSAGLFANISYVDFVGLVLGMTLSTASDGIQTALGLQPGAVASICADLIAQSASDGQPWGDLCVTDTSGTPLRVLAPYDYISINPDAFSDYWTSYVDDVWSYYTTNTLTIDTQAAAGLVSCTVVDGLLCCDGDNRGYAQPTASDIFGCNSGPFAIEAGDNAVHSAVVPRLCAAFDRSTLMLGDGNTQPGPAVSEFYTTAPTNWYSKSVHKYEIDGKGYAFAYDDVVADGAANQAGVVADGSPVLLTVTVGGPSS